MVNDTETIENEFKYPWAKFSVVIGQKFYSVA